MPSGVVIVAASPERTIALSARGTAKDTTENAVVDDGERGAGVVQDVLERGAFQSRIYWYVDRAEIVDGEYRPQRQGRCR
jgi:hypothetical protein